MVKRVFAIGLYLFMFSTSFPVYGQSEVKIDSSSFVEVRVPLDEGIQRYANDPNFKYLSTPDNPNSITNRILNFILTIILAIFGNPVGEFIFKAFFIAIIVGFIFALVNQLMDGELIYMFNKKSSKNGFKLGIEQQEFENTDYEQLFSQAIVQDDFHAATRYGYLIALKLLSQKKIISWGIEKTNIDYINELKEHPLKPDFETLTTFYEYVEYGDFEIDTYGFETFKSTFNRFKLNIHE